MAVREEREEGGEGLEQGTGDTVTMPVGRRGRREKNRTGDMVTMAVREEREEGGEGGGRRGDRVTMPVGRRGRREENNGQGHHGCEGGEGGGRTGDRVTIAVGRRGRRENRTGDMVTMPVRE